MSVYPKVKVRPNEQDDCLSPPNDIKSPSIQEKENQSCSALPIAMILRAYVMDSTIQLSSSSKVENKRASHVNDEKPNVRACSVPRPRAVLSSPNNDGMIGSRNKLINERRPILKVHKPEERATKRSDGTNLVLNVVKPEKRPLKNSLAKAKASEKEVKSRSDDQKRKMRKVQEPIVGGGVVKSQRAITKTSLKLGKPSV